MEKDLENKDEGYTFVKETIKKKPPVVVIILLKILKMLGLGVVFGVGVCLVMMLFGNKSFLDIFRGAEKETETKSHDDFEMVSEEVTDINDKDNIIKEPAKNIEEVVGASLADILVVRNEEIETTLPDDKKVITTRDSYTGVIVSKRSAIYICTEYEKVRSADNIYISFDGGKTQYDGEIYGVNEVNNMAIIKVRKTDVDKPLYEKLLQVEVCSLDEMSSGEKIIFVGNPYKEGRLIYTGTLAGVVEQCNNFDNYQRIVITDILNKDIYDGFLFNEYGEIVAMVTTENTDNLLYNNITGICFSDMKYVYNAIVLNKKLLHIGIKGEEVTDEMRELTDEEIPDGMYVTEVSNTSTAFTSGVMVGDVIIRANARKVKNIKDIQNILDNIRLNDKIVIVLMRKIGTEYIRYEIEVPVSREL